MKKFLVVFTFILANFNSFCQDFDPILCEPWLKNAYYDFIDENPCDFGYHPDDGPNGPTIQRGFKDGLEYIHIRKVFIFPPPFFTYSFVSKYYTITGYYLGDGTFDGQGNGFEGDFEENEELLYNCSDGYPSCGPSIPTFTDVTPINFPSNEGVSQVSIGDIDNNGLYDVIMDKIIYYNRGNNSWQKVITGFDGFGTLSDYNKDGWLDFYNGKLYFNNGQGNLILSQASFSRLTGKHKLIDINNDGSIFLLNNTDNVQPCSFFSSSDCGGLFLSSNTCHDYENQSQCYLGINRDHKNLIVSDGKLITDYTNNSSFVNLRVSGKIKSMDIDNDGQNDFIAWDESKTGKLIIDVQNKPLVDLGENFYRPFNFGDFNNDGNIDLLNRGIFYQNSDQATFKQDLHNFDTDAEALMLIDFDNDGDLDVLQISCVEGARLFRNESTIKNQKPNRPQNLQANVKDNKVVFAWTNGGDDLTSYPTYNLYIKNLTTNKIVYFPHSDTLTGQLRLLDKGNCEYNNGWFLQNLPPGQYRWKVQAVDQGYLSSEWAVGADFEIANESIVILALPSQSVKYQDTFSIPVVVTGFQDILSFQFPITWDTTVLEIIQVHSLNNKLPNFTMQNDSFKIRNKGEIKTIYFQPEPFSLSTFDTLFSIQFRAISQGCDYSVVSLPHVINYPPPAPSFEIEIRDKNFNALTYITTDAYITIQKAFFQSFSICSSETVQVGSNTYNMQGIYMDTLQSSTGCDSIITTTITLKPGAAFFQEVQICQGESISVGINTYIMQGTYIDTLQSSFGCDSIVTTTITLKPDATYSQEIQICQGESISVGSNTYTMQGTYIDTLQSSIGCDSIVATTITFKPDATYSQEIQICQVESISIGSNTYTMAGTYIDTLQSYIGCDSIVTTTISLKPDAAYSQEIQICQGESISIGTKSYTISGSYVDTLIAKNGCDSTVQTYLNVRQTQITDDIIVICSGQSHKVGSKIYIQSGNYIDTLQSIFGCDSIISTFLTVRPSQNISFNAPDKICKGTNVNLSVIALGTYLWSDGQTTSNVSEILNANKTYQVTVTDQFGCKASSSISITVVEPKINAIPIADTLILCFKDSIINPYNLLAQFDANGTWTLDEINISGQPFNLMELTEGIHTFNYGFSQQAPCSDMDTSFILLIKDCRIMDCSFTLIDDSIRVNKNEASEISLTINDILPEEYIISIISVDPDVLESTNLSDEGLYSFTVTGDFGDIVQVVYEICTPDCADCKQASLWIDNEALKDIIRTNIILPNTSGQNATLRFTDEDILRDSELYIFNRNGDRIFHMKDYDNSWNADGYPGGIYFYVLRYRGVDIKKTLTVMK